MENNEINRSNKEFGFWNVQIGKHSKWKQDLLKTQCKSCWDWFKFQAPSLCSMNGVTGEHR